MLIKTAAPITESEFQEATNEYTSKLSNLNDLITTETISNSYNNLLSKRASTKETLSKLIYLFDVDINKLITDISAQVKVTVASKKNETTLNDVSGAVKVCVNSVFDNINLDRAAEKLEDDESKLDKLKKSKELCQKLLTFIFYGISKQLLSSAGLPNIKRDLSIKDIKDQLPTSIAPGTGVFTSILPKLRTKTPSQKVFPINPNYSPEMTRSYGYIAYVPNNEESIKNLLITLTNQVYSNVDPSLIVRSNDFNIMLEEITNLNRLRSIYVTDNVVFPEMFSNKKQIVDFFIDDVASLATPAVKKSNHRKYILQQILKSS